MPSTILIVEDDPSTVELVRLYLSRDGHKVLAASEGHEGLRLAREAHPELVVLDLMLPGLDGMEICRILREESDVPIVMLTARVEEEDRLAGLDLGADDYITKPFSPRELAPRIRAVLRRTTKGDTDRGPAELRHGDITANLRLRAVSVGAMPVRLTPTEFRLLVLLMREPGRTFTREEIMDKVFGYDFEGFDRAVDAQVVGTSPADDIALLKVDPEAVKGIVPLALGDSSAAKPGQMAIALGSPFGLEDSIAVGVVSGVNRSRPGVLGRPITGMVQTDASINPGNSGGPLLNSHGEVVGINTAIETSANGATGVGFAIPVNTAKNVLAQLLNNTTVKRPWLGISGVAMSAGLSDQLGITTPRGIYILTVAASSPAEKAGLKGGGIGTDGGPGTGGDIITAANGRSVGTVEDLVTYFNSLRPGDTVSLTLVRNGQTIQVGVVLAEWPDTLGSTPR